MRTTPHNVKQDGSAGGRGAFCDRGAIDSRAGARRPGRD